tara:strand:+ start:2500 stop:3753 length:1254 start_codon:yes stop_codon:yes gene_type:complete
MQRKHAQKELNTSYYVFFSLVIMQSLRPINSSGVYGILDNMANELNITINQAQQSIVSPFLFGLIFGQFMVGPLSDRFGRVNIFIIFLNIYAIFCLLCGIGDSNNFLWIFRVLSGLTAAIGEISVMAIINDFCSLEKGSKLYSKISGAAGIIIGLTPLALNIAAQHLGWRSYFTINAIVCCSVSAIASYLIFALGSKINKQALSLSSIKQNFKYTLGNRMYQRFCFMYLVTMVIFELVFVLSPIMLLERLHVSKFEYTIIVGVVVGIMVFASANLNARLLQRYSPVSISFVTILTALVCAIAQVFLFSLSNEMLEHIGYVALFCIMIASCSILTINFFVLATQSATGKGCGGFVSSLTISIGSVGLVIGIQLIAFFDIKSIISAYIDLTILIAATVLYMLLNYKKILKDCVAISHRK